ncbi:MAG TPA: hypothetical protein VF462_05365 [Micromonosporaceae bacterium]
MPYDARVGCAVRRCWFDSLLAFAADPEGFDPVSPPREALRILAFAAVLAVMGRCVFDRACLTSRAWLLVAGLLVGPFAGVLSVAVWAVPVWFTANTRSEAATALALGLRMAHPAAVQGTAVGLAACAAAMCLPASREAQQPAASSPETKTWRHGWLISLAVAASWWLVLGSSRYLMWMLTLDTQARAGLNGTGPGLPSPLAELLDYLPWPDRFFAVPRPLAVNVFQLITIAATGVLVEWSATRTRESVSPYRVFVARWSALAVVSGLVIAEEAAYAAALNWATNATRELSDLPGLVAADVGMALSDLPLAIAVPALLIAVASQAVEALLATWLAARRARTATGLLRSAAPLSWIAGAPVAASTALALVLAASALGAYAFSWQPPRRIDEPSAAGASNAGSTSGPTPAASDPAPHPSHAGSWESLVGATLDCPHEDPRHEIHLVVRGDATGDGRPEVFVAASCTGATSSWPQQLLVFQATAGPATWRRLTVLLGYRDGTDDRGLRFKGISVRGQTVVVSSAGYREPDANAAGATVPVTDEFRWDGSRFVRGARRIGS